MLKSLGMIFLPLVAFLGVLLFPSPEVRSQSLELSSFYVDTHQEYLAARFSIKVEKFEEIKQALDNGTKMTMQSNLTLYRKRSLIWDEKLHTSTLDIEMEKLLLSGEYMINYPDRETRIRELDKEQFVSLFQGLSNELVPSDSLDPEEDYYVEVEIRLKTRDAPQWIRGILFFWSWDAAQGVKYEMDLSM